jgi:hypothetical protein
MMRSLAQWAGSATAMMLFATNAITSEANGPEIDKAAEVDSDAAAALEKMGAALRTHQIFTVTADIATEDVLNANETLVDDGTVTIYGRRPDRLRISQDTDILDREIYFDGKAFTVFSPRLKLHASVPGAATIAQTITRARNEYGVHVPLAELLTWADDRSLGERLKSGVLLGSERVADRMCSHYEFKQDAAEWQVWIAQDRSELPCKLVVTKSYDPVRPQLTTKSSAVLRWSFPESIPEDMFAFAPPGGTKELQLTGPRLAIAGGKRR